MSETVQLIPHQDSPRCIRLNEADNVAVVVNDGGVPVGAQFEGGLVTVEAVPQSHKVALVDIGEGEPVRRYGQIIGYALEPLRRGSWVKETQLKMPSAPPLDSLPRATAVPAALDPLEGYTFEGYRNTDGTVGTRNILGISTTVQCVTGVLEHAVKRIRDELLPKYPNVDDVVALTHSYGCGVAINARDAYIPIRTVRNLARNPNLGGEALVISLGCEKLQAEQVMHEGDPSVDLRDPWLYRLQESNSGFGEMIEQIMALAETRLKKLHQRRRETVPASELILGMQCGGSDAFSGITANPALGYAADLLVRAGATVMFSENTEVRDAVYMLTARAETPEVADAPSRRDGLVRPLPGARRRGPQRQHHAGQQEGRVVEHRREVPGLHRQIRQWRHQRRGRAGRAGRAKGPDLLRHPGVRLRLRHAAAGRRDEPARVHHRPRYALRPGDGAGGQGGDAHRTGRALA